MRPSPALVGSQADEIKRQAGDAAGKVYSEGRRQVAQTYDEVSGKAAELYGDAKDRIGQEAVGRGNGVH